MSAFIPDWESATVIIFFILAFCWTDNRPHA